MQHAQKNISGKPLCRALQAKRPKHVSAQKGAGDVR